jgi:hypothetical protein
MYVFFHAEFKYIIIIALSSAVFAWKNFLNFNFSEFSFFCHATDMYDIWLRQFIVRILLYFKHCVGVKS